MAAIAAVRSVVSTRKMTGTPDSRKTPPQPPGVLRARSAQSSSGDRVGPWVYAGRESRRFAGTMLARADGVQLFPMSAQAASDAPEGTGRSGSGAVGSLQAVAQVSTPRQAMRGIRLLWLRRCG